MLKQAGYEIKLYADKTYEINDYWHGESNHYLGTYKLSGDTLHFDDPAIEDKTEDQVITIYHMNHRTGRFQPLSKGYSDLQSHH